MNNLDKAQEQHDLDNQVKYYPEDGTCPLCEGDKKVFIGMTTGFDVKNMEFYAKDICETCPKCEGEGRILK